MPKKRKSIATLRYQAYKKQKGKCFYCNAPMWLRDLHFFAAMNGLTLSQARAFQCTGEHLLAKSSGGCEQPKNIVAACWYCNSRRHRRKAALTPEKYRKFVQKKVKSGVWPPYVLRNSFRIENTETKR